MQKQWVRIEEKTVIFINRSLIGGTVRKVHTMLNLNDAIAIIRSKLI
jgi:hypothetical protein